MEGSRREKSAKNLIYAWLNQGVMLIMNIVVRMVFVRVLSKEYLGLSGLFGNMISLLSLAELGIGTAIVYSLYEPLAHGDRDRIGSLMKFFQKVYIAVGATVLLIGILLTPYLSFFMKEMPDIPEIYWVYLLFVINSAVSYCFSYKGSLISADQNDYIVKKVKLAVMAAMYVLQIFVLMATGDYLLFLGIQIVFTLAQNLIYTWVANRMYPFLRDKRAAALEPDVLKRILTNTKALMLHKVGDIAKFSTDNLIISKFVGLMEVGLYSNYTLIQQALTNVLAQIFTSMTASVGNLGVTEDADKKYQTYKKVYFLNAWIFGLCSIAFLCLAQDFIGIFFGESYVMGDEILFLIVLNFYLVGMRKSTLTFRDAFGLFGQNRYMPLAEAGINLGLSLLLVNRFGIAGVLAGTALSTFLLPWWVEPYVVFRYGLEKRTGEYWKQYWRYTLVTAAAVVITWWVCDQIPLERSLILLMVKALIGLIIPNAIYILLYRRQEEYRYYKEFILNMKGKAMNSKKLHETVDWLAAGMLMISLCLLYISRTSYDKIISYAPMLAFVVLAILFFNHVNWFERLKNKEVELILLIAGSVIAGINLVLAKSGFGVIFNIVDFLLVLYLADKVKLDRRITYAIGAVCLVIFGTWIGQGDKTFNTNLACMIIFAVAVYGITVVTDCLHRFHKGLWGKGISLAVMLGLAAPMVWRLRARGILVGIVVFLLLNYLIPNVVWKCKKIYGACVMLLIGGSIAVPMWYVWLWKSGTQISFISLGKSFFSGRNQVWDQFLTAFYKEPWTGIGSDFYAKIPDLLFSEVHNGLLHILVVHGIIVFAVAAFLLGKRLLQIGRHAGTNLVTRQCISAIVALAVASIFENYFVLVFYNMLVLLLFCMGNREDNPED